jgi:L-arabinose isomerase
MNDVAVPQLWLVGGSQQLYGPGPLEEVAGNARRVAAALDEAAAVPLPVRFRAVLTTPEEIHQACSEANADPDCAGLILWMHTFSPARMWIGGLAALRKPMCHLHTQFNRELPWDAIDMDFLNLNQAAHGDREAGFLHTRMRLARKVVVGHWSSPEVHQRLAAWARAAHAWHDLQGAKIARFGDNMREVAVTEGDKVAAQLRFGFAVNGYGVGDLVERVDGVADADVAELLDRYQEAYEIAPELRSGGDRRDELRYGARLELGLRAFLEQGGFTGFTTSFEVLHGLRQLPGLAVQRLMADGYGFGAEGDWKTAALVRALKVMAAGLPNGTSFMEDYTYHLSPDGPQVLGSHMLEICPTIAAGTPRLEIHPLGIGGKEDPLRLVFDAKTGPAINVSLIDLGNRFRLLVGEVDSVGHPDLPSLPVARAVWTCRPDFETACAAWIHAGGAHHTVFSLDLTTEHIEDFAEVAGVELVVIDRDTSLRRLRQDLRAGDLYYALNEGLRSR